jgi:hypothetical protein
MSARDANTMRQVSLAALLGLDARPLLTTDDPVTHVVYAKLIRQAREWYVERAQSEQRSLAVLVINTLGEALK